MTELTAEQKATVVKMMGWERCISYHSGAGAHWKDSAIDARLQVCKSTDEVLTIDGLLGYCRKRGWAHSLTFWRGTGLYVVELFDGEEDDPWAENIGDAQSADPIQAFTLALLATAAAPIPGVEDAIPEQEDGDE